MVFIENITLTFVIILNDKKAISHPTNEAFSAHSQIQLPSMKQNQSLSYRTHYECTPCCPQ